MITFKYEDGGSSTVVSVEVRTETEFLDALVEHFRTFLTHIGHHPDNVERVVLREKEGRQGLPQQLELFPDEDYVEQML